MKKLTLIAAVLSLAGLSAFAQSSVLFSATGTGTAHVIWDEWSTLAPKADASNNVAFLWATAGTPSVDSIFTQTVTNSAPLGAQGSAAWTAILNDPNFHFATNSAGNAAVITPSSAAGNISYNGNASFTLAGYGGPSPTGSIIIFMVAWANTYANPFLAAAANAPVGWSAPFTYTLGTPTSGAVAFTAATSIENLKLGVQSVPEPTTLALLGLSSAGLLIFRRKKS